MDLAQEVEYKALASYKPVEKLIQNANSNVQLFYKNDIVFLTGGSGFLGKQYIEKMFRTCDIKKMYVLIRPKKGKTIQDRIKFILDDPVFDKLRMTKPNFAEQIFPVEGDVADIRLGLSDKEWETVAKDTSIVVHMAATIRFDSPIKVAVVTNVRGTREVIALAKDCKNLNFDLLHGTNSWMGRHQHHVRALWSKVFYLKSDLSLNIAPVDIVNNAIIAAGWDSVQNRSKASDGIPIYTVSSTKCEIPWSK
ncbi:hypothetical protein HF086_007644 [Spodoptera exigua]|uniref:Fatty acyl-CoA reductase n=1 Tax=Spodoptera exigua TaxID=7107 RepID=A0A922MAT8_SPOEX|nr:hypothetical protein HF086_007644 [Spodoptera exigua]